MLAAAWRKRDGIEVRVRWEWEFMWPVIIAWPRVVAAELKRTGQILEVFRRKKLQDLGRDFVREWESRGRSQRSPTMKPCLLHQPALGKQVLYHQCNLGNLLHSQYGLNLLSHDFLPHCSSSLLLFLDSLLWLVTIQSPNNTTAKLLSRFSRVQSCVTQWTAAHQAPPSLGFSRQEHWSGLPFPSPMHESEKWKWSRSYH